MPSGQPGSHARLDGTMNGTWIQDRGLPLNSGGTDCPSVAGIDGTPAVIPSPLLRGGYIAIEANRNRVGEIREAREGTAAGMCSAMALWEPTGLLLSGD